MAVSFRGPGPRFGVSSWSRTAKRRIDTCLRKKISSQRHAPFAAPRNLVRLSVGIEAADDLVADLEAALVRSASPASV